MKLKNRKIIFLWLAIWLAAIILIYLAYNHYSIKDVKEIPISFIVGNSVGFNLSKTELNFGILPAGASGTREVIINSNESSRIVIFIEGDAKRFVSVNENNFVFNGSRALVFSINIPNSTLNGNYNGKAVIVFRKA